jgi:hypothetical protein
MRLNLNLLLSLSFSCLLILGCNSGQSVSTQSPKPSGANPNSPSETVNQGNKGTVIKSGTFIAAEQPTEGKVSIVTRDGKTFLELDQAFKASENAPDLILVLHRSPDILKSTQPPTYPLQESDYVVIAPLEKFSGEQSYEIPNTIKLDDYHSVAVWCRQFNATFGVASLN